MGRPEKTIWRSKGESTGGRPRDYCLKTCGRGAEAELRRLARRLKRAEDERDRADLLTSNARR